MQNEFSVSGHYAEDFDEKLLQTWAAELRARLQSETVSLGLVFMTPQLFPKADQVLEILRIHGQVSLLIGCSSTGLITDGQEHENCSGLVLALYHLPGADLKAYHFNPSQIERADNSAYWHDETDIIPENTNGWLVFADPFHMDCEAWLNQWNEAYAPLPILGGLSSGNLQAQRSQLYLDNEVFEEGGVAVSVGGHVRLTGVISQGCTPIGETWTITKAQGNIILEIGNRPAYQMLMKTVGNLNQAEQKTLQDSGGKFLHIVVHGIIRHVVFLAQVAVSVTNS